MRVIKIKSWNDVPNEYTGIAKYPNGSRIWCLNRNLHREDGPAVERVNSLKEWYLNDEFLFGLPPESQPFILVEEVVNEEGKEQIKVLTQNGIETWPNLPGLKELADNWSKL